MAKKDESNVNTTSSMMNKGVVSDAELVKEMANLESKFSESKDEWVTVTLPEAVAKLIGSPYYGSFNGVPYTLVAKVPKKLPKPIAEHVNQIIVNAS